MARWKEHWNNNEKNLSESEENHILIFYRKNEIFVPLEKRDEQPSILQFGIFSKELISINIISIIVAKNNNSEKYFSKKFVKVVRYQKLSQFDWIQLWSIVVDCMRSIYCVWL